MERQTKKRHLPFLTAQAKASHLYAVDIDTDDFIEMAYTIWRSIGNIATVLTRYFTKVPADFIIELPQQCEFIDSVTSIDRQTVATTHDSGGEKDRHVPAAHVRSNLPEINQSITSSSGMSINYITLDNNSIKITSPVLVSADIMIVYRSLDLDEDGLPLLNDKEVEAIAAEVAKRVMLRKGFQGIGTKDKTQQILLQYILVEAARLMTAAKITENISDDEIDQMLNIQTSWDRKVFGRRFKLLK